MLGLLTVESASKKNEQQKNSLLNLQSCPVAKLEQLSRFYTAGCSLLLASSGLLHASLGDGVDSCFVDCVYTFTLIVTLYR